MREETESSGIKNDWLGYIGQYSPGSFRLDNRNTDKRRFKAALPGNHSEGHGTCCYVYWHKWSIGGAAVNRSNKIVSRNIMLMVVSLGPEALSEKQST